jgi:lipoprotein-releasing system ATP-binding protein
LQEPPHLLLGKELCDTVEVFSSKKRFEPDNSAKIVNFGSQNIVIMLYLHQIKKQYGTLHVLKGVDLHIEKGELVSIVGKSGAGKSTLLHIAGLLDKPDSGAIKINGLDTNTLKGNKLAAFRNKHIGFVFQFHHLLPEFSALENVMLPLLIAGTSKKEAALESSKILEYLGLEERVSHKPSELSGGEQQRVAIGRALVANPSIVFADEPTGNLDSNSSQDIHKLFLRLREDFDQTFMIVTHNVELAAMTDRTLRMEDGKFLNQS